MRIHRETLFVVLMLISVSLGMSATNTISLLLPLLKNDIAMSFTQAGLLFSLPALVYAFMQLPAGAIADSFEPKVVVAFSCILGNGFLLTLGFVQAYWQGLTAQLFIGICQAFMFPASLILLASWLGKERRAMAASLFVSSIVVGQVLVNLFSPLLATNFSWRSVFMVCGLWGTVAALILFYFHGRTRGEIRRQRLALKNFASVLRNRVMWTVCGIQFIRVALFNGIGFWLPTLLINEVGFPLTSATLIVSIRFILIACAALSGSYVTDRLKNPTLVIGASLLILAVTTFSMAVTHNVVLLLMAIAVNSVFASTYVGALYTVTLEAVGTNAAGSATGVGNFFANMGGFCFTLLLGYLKDSSNSFESGFLLMGALCIGGLVLNWLCARMRKVAATPIAQIAAR